MSNTRMLLRSGGTGSFEFKIRIQLHPLNKLLNCLVANSQNVSGGTPGRLG